MSLLYPLASAFASPQTSSGWSCSPRRAASAASGSREKCATRLAGLPVGCLARRGRSKNDGRASSAPRFAALPDRPSFVETASSTGRPLRRCALQAKLTGESAMPFASLPSVLPVQGATISRSSRRFGPSGSTCASVCSGSVPHSAVTSARKSADAPKRVSVSHAASEKMGTTVYCAVRARRALMAFQECAERAAQGKADSRSHAGNAPSCSRIAAA